jgi:hypothetical protein
MFDFLDGHQDEKEDGMLTVGCARHANRVYAYTTSLPHISE